MTGSWWGSTGGSHRLLGQLKSQFGQPGVRLGDALSWSTPGRWTPTAGTATRNSRARASRAKAGTSSTPSAGGPTACPTEVYAVPGPEHDDLQATVRFRTARLARSRMSPAATPLSRRRRWTPPAGGRSARLDNFRQAAVWTGRRRTTCDRAAARTRVSAHSSSGSSRPAGPALRCRSQLDSLVATTRATIAVGRAW